LARRTLVERLISRRIGRSELLPVYRQVALGDIDRKLGGIMPLLHNHQLTVAFAAVLLLWSLEKYTDPSDPDAQCEPPVRSRISRYMSHVSETNGNRTRNLRITNSTV